MMLHRHRTRRVQNECLPGGSCGHGACGGETDSQEANDTRTQFRRRRHRPYVTDMGWSINDKMSEKLVVSNTPIEACPLSIPFRGIGHRHFATSSAILRTLVRLIRATRTPLPEVYLRAADSVNLFRSQTHN